MRIGSKIQALRRVAGMTQADLAEKMQVSFQTISGWERDEYLPDTARLRELAQALNSCVSALLDEEELPPWQLHDRIFDEERMHSYVKASATAKGYAQTVRALAFAREKHAGQLRKGVEGVPYINHPLTMACQALALGLGDDVVAAALLHDVCEDCGVAPEALPASAAVQRAVELLSFEQHAGEDWAQAKARYFAGVAGNPIASIVKLMDRCSNLSTMGASFSRGKMIEYMEETEKYILPLAGGIQSRWPELSNAAFLLKYQIRSILEPLKGALK